MGYDALKLVLVLNANLALILVFVLHKVEQKKDKLLLFLDELCDWAFEVGDFVVGDVFKALQVLGLLVDDGG